MYPNGNFFLHVYTDRVQQNLALNPYEKIASDNLLRLNFVFLHAQYTFT